jgi:hypothetical protein
MQIQEPHCLHPTIICFTVPAQEKAKSFNMGLITLPCNIQQANNAKDSRCCCKGNSITKLNRALKGKYTDELFIELAR